MDTTSPPLTPIRTYMSGLPTSPTSSAYRESLRRRNSSFSSQHSRATTQSPITPRKSNRLSYGSSYSNDFQSHTGEGGEGLGNLADELDQLDDEEDDYDGETIDSALDIAEDEDDEAVEEPSPIDGARDSGVDISYSSKRSSPLVRNFSKPFSKPPEGEVDRNEDPEPEEKLPPGLEDAVNTVARTAASSASVLDDPHIRRLTLALQDLGSQSGLEGAAQRLTNSTNSFTAHLLSQSKSLQSLSTGLWSPLAFSGLMAPDMAEQTLPLVEELLRELPTPDPAALPGLQRIDRESAGLVQTLRQLTDTLQMGKQTTNEAARVLRTTQAVVADLRLEREGADEARHQLQKGGMLARMERRACAEECRDVLAGFEEVCDALEASLIEDAGG